MFKLTVRQAYECLIDESYDVIISVKGTGSREAFETGMDIPEKYLDREIVSIKPRNSECGGAYKIIVK